MMGPLRVSGGNYNAKRVAGGFRGHTAPPVLALANFGSRPEAAIQRTDEAHC